MFDVKPLGVGGSSVGFGWLANHFAKIISPPVKNTPQPSLSPLLPHQALNMRPPVPETVLQGGKNGGLRDEKRVDFALSCQYTNIDGYTVGLRRRKLRSITGSDGEISRACINRVEAASNSFNAMRETALPFNDAASSGAREIVASHIRLATP